MQIANQEKAQVLAQALPYIQAYSGKVVVVKYGGNAMIDGQLKAAVMSDLVLLSLVGIRIVLVHGGGPEINEALRAVGKRAGLSAGCATRTPKRCASCRWCWPERRTRTLSTCWSGRGVMRSGCAASTAA